MPSFDVVSRTELPEVDNALQGAMREISTRFDFKGSQCSIERTDEVITVKADDDLKLKQVHELLRGYLAKRKVDHKALEFKEPEKASGNSIRQNILIKQGIERDLAQKVVKAVKAAKLKNIQVAIQGDELRVSGKKRDELQTAIALIKEMKLEQPLQYVNFRD
ncbi:MAG: YajQ family cyclic di-GMP-binding protein [Proteobacteria bacterium]|nr:YajQ family cyclic di-GMP-binding protein [Pseudomonadota bacterium]